MLVQHNTPIAGRPVVAASFALDYAVGELSVAPYHVTNIAIHVLCALLVFAIARHTLKMKRLPDLYALRADDLALATAVIWVVHPLNSEAVDYITQRTESLMALFLLLTLYAAIRERASARGSWWWRVVAVISCAAGMGCKESMAVAPVIVIVYDRAFLFESFGDAVAARWRLYAMLAATWIILGYLMLPGPRSGSVGLHQAPSPIYLVNQVRMIARYFRLSVWPSDLVVNYGPVDTSLRLRDVIPQGIVLAAFLTASFAAFVRWPALGFLGAWILITLGPTSSVIPVVTEVGAERRMYLPLVAMVAFVVIGIYSLRIVRARVSSQAAMAAVAIVASALGAITLMRNREYSSGLSLAQSTLRRWPTDVAHGMVGAELMTLHRDSEAVGELQLAARTDARARYNLGAALFNMNQYDAAIRELTRMADEYPMREEVPLARRLAGRAYALQRNWPEAIKQLTPAVSMMPGDASSRTWLAHALNGEGLDRVKADTFDEAVGLFRRASELDPARADVRHNLVAALLDSGNAASAEHEARRAIDHAPNDAESRDLLGRALALQGKMAEALAELRRAVELSPQDARIQDDLRRVQAEIKARAPRVR